MRAGPLSDSNVIAILNRYYVPVYTSNEISGSSGSGPAEEREARNRIYSAFVNAHLSTGDVHVYILAPDGRPAASLNIDQAMDTGQLTAALRRVVKELGTEPGEPVIEPKPQSTAPQPAAGQIVFHVSARWFRAGSWSEFPGENWIVLQDGDWKKLLPPGPVSTDSSWLVDSSVARKLLTNFYPPTEDTSSADRNRIEEHSLKATIVSVTGPTALARLDGTLRMKRSFYPGRNDDTPVEATLIGFMDFDPARRTIESFALTTEKAVYGSERFTAGLHALTSASVAKKEPQNNHAERHSQQPGK